MHVPVHSETASVPDYGRAAQVLPVNIVLPDNTAAGEWMLPQIDQAYRTGDMPSLLPAAGNSDPRASGPIALPPA